MSEGPSAPGQPVGSRPAPPAALPGLRPRRPPRLAPLDTGSYRPPPQHFLEETFQQLLDILEHPEQRKRRRHQAHGGGQHGPAAGPAPEQGAAVKLQCHKPPGYGWQAAEYSTAQLQTVGEAARELVAFTQVDQGLADVLVDRGAALPDARLQRLLVGCLWTRTRGGLPATHVAT